MTQDRQTKPDTDTLSSEEQRVAALYRSLPAGEPSPALDARIRAQARAAVKPARRKRPTWLWGAGVAASALLAVGMFWRMGLPELEERGPAVSGQTASKPARDDTAVLDSVAMAPPPMPPEPRRVGAAEPTFSASGMSEQDEALGAAEPASPSGQLSANQAARERAAAPAVVRPAPAEKQEGFADGRADSVARSVNEAKAGTAAGEPPRLERAETRSSRQDTEEEQPVVAQEPAPPPDHGALPPPVVFDTPSPMAIEAPPPAPPAPPPPPPPPPPIVFDEPSEMAVEMPPPAPPAPPAPPVELPAQAAPVIGTPKVIRQQKEVGEREAESRQLGKVKGDDVGAINVADNDISPIDVSSVESADVLAETATKDSDAVAKAIAELPRRFRRDVGRNSRLYPESWLARIDALLATDKREEAVANLRVFRVAYPEQVLPEALAALAREEGIDSKNIGGGDPQP